MAKRSFTPPPESKNPLHRIRFKVNLAVGICGLILMFFSLWLLTDSMNFVEVDLTENILASDTRYLCALLGESEKNTWQIKDGALYLGDRCIGDGTAAGADTAAFVSCQKNCGSFFNAFVRTFNDSELVYVADKGYQQGHYLRTACSATGSDHSVLVGTYLDKNVVDKLESAEDGIYSAEVSVEGVPVFCRYQLLHDANGEDVGIIVAGRTAEDMKTLFRKQKIRGFLMIIAMLILISVGLGAIVTKMLLAIDQIKKRLNLIGTGEFPDEPLRIHTGDEMEEIADAINEMVVSLEEKERISTELSLATDIQAHMLPSIFPPFPERSEFDLYATMHPAKEVGGDFYDFFMVDENRLALVIADVSGKGVPAALFMVVTKTLMKNQAQGGSSPAEVFTAVNRMLCEGNDAGLFVTAWIGILDITTGKLTYANAGHNPPLLKHGTGEFEYCKRRTGIVLAGLNDTRYREAEMTLSAGDKLFLYTDGVTEATAANGKLYGEERLAAYLNAHADDNVYDTLNGLRADIDRFAGDAEQFDDITMLILSFREKGGNKPMNQRTFPAETDALPDAIAYVEEELEKIDCPMKTVMQITVCVEEMFVNVANYAYKDTDNTDGEITLAIDEEQGIVSITLTDSGVPFNPLEKEDPDIHLSAEEREVGGLGIFMVKKSMNEVHYERKDGKNIFTMRKEI